MKLPHQIQMDMLKHGSGAGGMSFYVYGNREHGVYQTALRESSLHSFISSFSYAYLPGQEFKTYREVCMAAESVTPEQIEVEKAKYPVLIDCQPVKPNGAYTNACRLCPWGADRREKHPEKHRAHLARDGSGYADDYVGLCDEHVPLTKDPAALIAALDAEVKERTARAKDFFAGVKP